MDTRRSVPARLLNAIAAWLAMVFLVLPPALDAAEALKLIVPDGYLPGIPVLVRVELVDGAGAVDRSIWDAEAVLSAANAALAPSRVVLRNGLGSALVSVAGEGAVELAAVASVGGVELSARKTLRSLAADSVTDAGGSLPAGLSEWNGIVRVGANLTVPADATLEIQPGTLVLLAGVSSGENGVEIKVLGTLRSLGSEERPVTFTALDPSRPWGELDHDGATEALYRHTIITRAGNSPRGGHTNTGPALRATDSRLRLEHCSITDTKGKSMTAAGSSLELADCLLSRSVMGPEINATALRLERCWLMEFYGTDDNDGIYLHSQRIGQELSLIDSVIASGDDDGVDTLGSDVTIEGCIVRDWDGEVDADAKGISVYGDSVTVRRSLIVDNHIGISAKGGGTVSLERSTVLGGRIAIESARKSNAPDVTNPYYVNSSILLGPEAIRTVYPPADIHLAYSSRSGAAPTGMDEAASVTADPMLVDPAAHDFHLRPGSPCIDQGDPAATDPDGSRLDIGLFPFSSGPREVSFRRGLVNGDELLDIGDPVTLLFHLFRGQPLACADAADANDDGALGLADAVLLLRVLFLQDAALPAPAESCGADLTADDPLDCESGPQCEG